MGSLMCQPEYSMDPNDLARQRSAVLAKQSSASVEIDRHKMWIAIINSGNSFIMSEMVDQDEYIVETLFADGERAIHRAVLDDDFELLVQLINDCGAHIDAPTAISGETALMMAAYNGRYEMLQFLLDCHEAIPLYCNPANPLLQCSAGRTAIDFAAENSDDRIWALLSPHTSREEYLLKKPTRGRRAATVKDVYDDVEEELHEDILDNMTDHELFGISSPREDFRQGFLQKRRAVAGLFPAQLKERYVVVENGYVGWNDKQPSEFDLGDSKDRKLFKKTYPLSRVVRVENMTLNSHRWFQLVAKPKHGGEDIVYEFKADNQRDRDGWVRTLSNLVRKAHKAAAAEEERKTRGFVPRV